MPEVATSVKSGWVDSNYRKPPVYQTGALNQLSYIPEASPVPRPIYVTGHRETDYTHNVYKLTLYLTLHCILCFHPKGIYRFNLLGLKIAAILPRLVVTAISDGLVIIII